MPRHPPCALTILTVIFHSPARSKRCRFGDTRNINVGYCAVFKVRGEPKVGTPPVEVSQNSTALRPGMGRSSSVDVSKAGVLDTELGAAEAEARDALLAGAPG
jgi:hypothetical protein